MAVYFNKRKVKALKYFKSTKGRNGAKGLKVICVHAVRDDGTIKSVDTVRNTIRVNLSFGSQPIGKLEVATKKEFEKELATVLDYKANG
jgi:hypothetical protein